MPSGIGGYSFFMGFSLYGGSIVGGVYGVVGMRSQTKKTMTAIAKSQRIVRGFILR